MRPRKKKVAVSKEIVERIAVLACLDIKAAQKELYLSHLNKILSYVSQLHALNTEEIEPTFQVLPGNNFFREDEIDDRRLPLEEVIMNAPESENNYFKMPKIL